MDVFDLVNEIIRQFAPSIYVEVGNIYISSSECKEIVNKVVDTEGDVYYALIREIRDVLNEFEFTTSGIESITMLSAENITVYLFYVYGLDHGNIVELENAISETVSMFCHKRGLMSGDTPCLEYAIYIAIPDELKYEYKRFLGEHGFDDIDDLNDALAAEGSEVRVVIEP